MADSKYSVIDFARKTPPGAVTHVDFPAGSPKRVALTVDFCAIQNRPAKFDAPYIEALRHSGIKWTAYLSGQWMRENPEITKQLIKDPRIQIGFHGDTHQAMPLVASQEAMKKEFDGPREIYNKLREDIARESPDGQPRRADGSVLPEKITSARLPWGWPSHASMMKAAEEGMTYVNWSNADGDASLKASPEKKATAMQRAVGEIIDGKKNGQIMLTHGTQRTYHDAEDVEKAIAAAKKAGYEFNTVDGLMNAPGATPRRSMKTADRALGEGPTSEKELLRAKCENEGGGQPCEDFTKGPPAAYSTEKKAAVRKQFQENSVDP